MSRYYCPFCSSRYQFYKTSSDGLKVCGQCGDELIKVPIFKMTQLIGLIGASAFLIPLLLMIVFLVKDLNNQRINKSPEQIAFISLNFHVGKY